MPGAKTGAVAGFPMVRSEESPELERPATRKHHLLGLMQSLRARDAEKHVAKGAELADKKKWKDARVEFNKAAEMYRDLDMLGMEARMLMSAALCDFALGESKKALSALRKALRAMRKVKDIEGEATVSLELGQVLFKTNKAAEAEKAFKTALRLFHSQDDHDGVVRTYKALERLYRKECRHAEADETSEKCEVARRLLATR